MAGFQALFLLVAIAINLQDTMADHHRLTDREQGSYEIVGTGAHSSLYRDESGDVNQNTGIYALRRQRRSAHYGLGLGHQYIRPVYVQPQPVAVVPQPAPVAVAPAYYPGHYAQAPPPQLSSSHSQSQAISASFGGNQLLGTGGSGISAAAASAGSGTNQNQLVHHGGLGGYGYGRK